MHLERPWESISDIHYTHRLFTPYSCNSVDFNIQKYSIVEQADFDLQGIQTLDELLLFLLLPKDTWHVLLQAGDDVSMHL